MALHVIAKLAHPGDGSGSTVYGCVRRIILNSIWRTAEFALKISEWR